MDSCTQTDGVVPESVQDEWIKQVQFLSQKVNQFLGQATDPKTDWLTYVTSNTNLLRPAE